MAANRGIEQLSDVEQQALEACVTDFDRQWGSGALHERASRLPRDSSWRLPALARMVKIDLERQWGLGNQLGLETYLQEYPELGNPSDVSADLIQAEYEVRKHFGAATELDEYARRFPAQVDELRRSIASGRSSLSLRPKFSSHLKKSATQQRALADTVQELPEQFGRYKILHRLGAGGMGSVYLAEDSRLKRKVALKIAHIGGSANRQVLERFYREAEAAAGLDHPYLCRVYDVGEIENVHYLTMEYIEGTSLADFIAGRKDRPQRQVAAIVGKLALALQEAHAKGVVHRDLKPANVMIRKTGEKAPVIVDFGLAQQMNAGGPRLTQKGQAMGTPHYMAIEQIKGDLGAIGPACDIYALGVILYKLLTGEVPFGGPNPMMVVTQILTTQAAPPSSLRPDLDPNLEAICLKAMAREIKDRYASMADFAAALAAYLKAPATAASGRPPGAVSAEAGEGASRTQGSDTLMGRFLEKAPDGDTTNPNITKLLNENRPAPRVPRSKAKAKAKAKGAAKGPRSRRPLIAALAAAAFVLLLGVVIYVITGTGTQNHFETVTNSIGMKLTLIPAGEFMMGSREDDMVALSIEKPQHKVIIKKPFYLGIYEVTQGQYRAVTGQSPSNFSGSDDLPVENVSWNDAVAFCTKLTETERRSGELPAAWEYRLPTEAQWEYACRAGSTGNFSFGDDESQLGSYAWYKANSGNMTHPVGRKLPNNFGIYDMYGNVYEWCRDWTGAYTPSPAYDPSGPAMGSFRVRRGGGWGRDPRGMRSADRNGGKPDLRFTTLGFRIARVSSGH